MSTKTSPVRERPIIFSSAMVRAILEGRKTMTRRVVRWPIVSNGIAFDRELGDIVCRDDDFPPSEMLMQVRRGRDLYYIARCDGWEQVCPYGEPGDLLWVREAWCFGDQEPCDCLPNACLCRPSVHYRADWAGIDDDVSWRSPTHMPRWASRLTLRVLAVRVERLQEITEGDAIAEGVERRGDLWSFDWSRSGTLSRYAEGSVVKGRDLAPLTEKDVGLGTARLAFGNGWNGINGKRAPWASSPWVWVVEFERVAAGKGVRA